jgi:hypothetical protein
VSRVETSIFIAVSPREVFAFHDDPRNLLKILPPFLRVETLTGPDRLRQGARLKYTMYIGPLRFDWEAEITVYQPPGRFVDVQRAGPFRSFEHDHRFEAEGQGTRQVDAVEYELPLGPLSELAARVQLNARLTEILELGQQSTRAILEARSR